MDDDAKTDEVLNQPDVDDNDNESESDDAKQSPKKAPKIVLLGAGVLIVVVIAVVGYLVFSQSSQASDVEGEEAVAAQEEEGKDDARSRRDTRTGKSRRGNSEEDIPGTDIFYTDFPASVVNLGPSENYDYIYLKYGINLELADAKVSTELNKKMPKIMSLIDSLLTGRKWDQIGTQRGRHALESEIVDTVNEELETGEVIACYFVTFVAQ